MKNKIIIISSIIILLLIATGGLYFYYLNYKSKKIVNSIIIQEKEQAEKRKKELADYEVIRLASAAKKIDACYKIASEAKDKCFYDLSRSIPKEEYCDQIENNESKKYCHGLFAYDKVAAQSDSQKCLTLESDLFRKQCLERFYLIFKEVSECEKFSSKDRARCLDVVNNNLAFNSNNLSACDVVEDKALRANCKMIINNKPKDSDGDGITDNLENSYGSDAFKADTDGDGLSDPDELNKYFTDPRKPDTDGDGYGDGDEVKNGFNPSGPGKMSVVNE
ncbi:MAG: hypothetical protein Q7K35_02525 [bacterium]|nr:hypothetical protein [bacterium]